MVNDANGIANRESHMIHSVPLSRCYRSFPEVSGFDFSRFGQDPSKTSRRLVLFALDKIPFMKIKIYVEWVALQETAEIIHSRFCMLV